MTMTPAQGRCVEVDGLSIYYELRGEGPPLVLLHGGLLTIEVAFGDVLAALAERHEVLPDARLAVVPGATHVGLLHETDLVMPILRRFLDT